MKLNVSLKIRIQALLFILVLSSSAIYGQMTQENDKIYNFVDKMPVYSKGEKGLTNYFNKELIPIISNCLKRDSDLIASLHIVLTIDKKGKVIDAIFPRPNLSDKCRSELKKKLLTMTGWKSGQLNHKVVCTHYFWPISCLKWQ